MTPVYALHRIHRGSDADLQVILPGTLFEPANQTEQDDLKRQEAVRDATPEELAFYEKTAPKKEVIPDDTSKTSIKSKGKSDTSAEGAI